MVLLGTKAQRCDLWEAWVLKKSRAELIGVHLVFFSNNRGAGPGCNTREIADRLVLLKAEIGELEQRERELDQHKLWVQQSIKNVTDDVGNHQMAYVTHEDICRCFKGDTLLAIQAPSGTQLEVPIPDGVSTVFKHGRNISPPPLFKQGNP